MFSPDAKEVAFAKRILEAMPDGTGAVMIDGKMQDDATWKQAKVIVDLARVVAAKDPEKARPTGCEPGAVGMPHCVNRVCRVRLTATTASPRMGG